MLPIKEYLYIAGLVLLGMLALHIYDDGKRSAEAADAKLLAAQQVHNEEVQIKVQDGLNKAIQDYEATHTKPNVTPKLVCTTAKTSSSAVPSNAGSPSPSNAGPPNPQGQDSQGFDPSPAVNQDAAELAAQLKLAQDYIRTCQSQGLCKK